MCALHKMCRHTCLAFIELSTKSVRQSSIFISKCFFPRDHPVGIRRYQTLIRLKWVPSDHVIKNNDREKKSKRNNHNDYWCNERGTFQSSAKSVGKRDPEDMATRGDGQEMVLRRKRNRATLRGFLFFPRWVQLTLCGLNLF